VGRGDESEAVEGLVPVVVAKVVERLVAAVKRVKGFEAGGAGGGGDSKLGFVLEGRRRGANRTFGRGPRVESRKDEGPFCKTTTAKRGESLKWLQVLRNQM
jgi:hypothetical protein